MVAKRGEPAWHPMSSDDRAQRNELPWKKKPTAIPIPFNAQRSQPSLPSHSSHITNTTMSRDPDHFNPLSNGRTANNLGPRTVGKRNKTSSTVGNRTANSVVAAPPPRKKTRLEARSKPHLAPERAVESDLVEILESSGDEINGFAEKYDKPQLDVQNGDSVHAFDVDSDSPPPSAVARIHGDGPATLSLEKKLDMSLSARKSSPIEEFQDEVKPPLVRDLVDFFEVKASSSKDLTQQASSYRDLDPPVPRHINFREQSTSLKASMRPSRLNKKPLESLTSPTPFHRAGRPAIAKSLNYLLPLNACYIDSRLIPDTPGTDPIHLVWNPGGKTSSIYHESRGEKVYHDFSIADVEYIEHTRTKLASDSYDGDMPVVKAVLLRGSTVSVRRPGPSSVPLKFPVDNVTIKLNTNDKDWTNGIYDGFLQWLRNHKIKINQSRNAKQMWEIAERTLPRDSEAEIILPQEDEPVLRLSVGPKTSDTRSQTDAPPEKPDIRTADDQTSGPRRSRRILTVKKPVIAVDPDEVILIYPQGAPGAINITNADVSRLEPGEFLNDTLIEFGLKLWHRELESSNPELAKQIHVFSSFFYKKLNKKNLDEGYESVRKWTAKINLFDKKYIIIPINEHLHWYLAIIFMPEHILQPPPPPPIKQTAASRTRSRTSLAAKAVAEIEAPSGSASPTPASAEEQNELIESMNDFSCAVSITGTNTPNGMDVSPDNSALQINHPPLEAQPVDEFAMDVDKSEEIAVQEQLRLASPTISELGTDRPQSSGSQPATTYMDVETEVTDKQGDSVLSRYFAKEPEANVVELNLQEQQVATTSGTEANPEGQILEEDVEDFDQQEEEDIQEPDDLNSSQKAYIFTLDSLGTRHPHAIKQLNKYLKLEAQDKRNISNTSDASGKTVAVPTQPNFCDCGVYLLHFAQTFMAEPAKYFKIINEHKKSPPIGERKEIWQDHKVGIMREELSDRIKNLSREWKQARAAKDEAKKDQTETVQESDSSDIEYVDLVAPASPVQGKGKKGTAKKLKPARLRG